MLKTAAKDKAPPNPQTAIFTGDGDPDQDCKNLIIGAVRGMQVPAKVLTTRANRLLGVVGWHTSPSRKF
jgi:hypothetical protein